MPNKLSIKTLLQKFSPVAKDQWIEAANGETKSNDALDELAWEGPEGIKFQPYYDQSDTRDLGLLKKFQLQPSASELQKPRHWYNLPPIHTSHATAGNQQALDHLQNGADGLLFEIEQSAVDFPALLDRILLPICHLSFMFEQYSEPKALLSYIQNYPAEPESISGSFFWKKNPPDSVELVNKLREQKKFLSLGLFIEKMENPVEEVSTALFKGVTLVDTLTDAGLSAEAVLQRIAFSIEAGNAFFDTVSKLKALRMLWYQIANAYGVSSHQYMDTFIHVRSEPWIADQFKPHSNMLRSTTAAMASVVGGCNALTVYPEKSDNHVMNRIARNISNILRDESHLDLVADPLAGSYFAESELAVFAERAWQSFQHKISSL